MGIVESQSAELTIDTTQTLDVLLHQVLNHALVAAEAEGGSLMLVDNKRGILQIKARLGVPRPGRKTEVIFKTSDPSVAAWVVENKRAYNCPNVDDDPNFAHSRSGKNFASLLSVPIKFDGKVIAVINADASQQHYFRDSHQEELERIARVVAEPIADRISILDAMAQVGVELARSPGEGGVERVLQKIAHLAVRSLGAQVVTLYPYDQANDDFPVEGTGPIIAGSIHDSGPMRRKVYKGDVPWTVVKERSPGFFPNVRDHNFLTNYVDRPGEAPRSRFIEREGIQSMAALLLPARAAENNAEEVVGVMFANYRSRHEFSIDEVSALASFADYAAAAILNARHEEKRRTDQMHMAEMFSASLAHRMSHLVGASRASAQLVRQRLTSGDEIAARALGRIEHEIDMLFELSERLVRPYRETGQLSQVSEIDLSAMLSSVLGELIRGEGQSINVDSDLPADLPQVATVEFQLRQVIHDVVENAVEAMRSQAVTQLFVRARYNPVMHRVELEVTDRGRGIPSEVQSRLFAPGVSTKEGRLGIGLWWCRTFMRAAGGDLRLATTSSQGTSFVIDIPCMSQEEKHVTSEISSRPCCDVLLVDDDPSWRETLEDAIADLKCSIKKASSLADAREALATQRFKLAVVDIRLVDSDEANLDGLRLVKDVQDAQLDTKIILITGWGADERRRAVEGNPLVIGFIDKRKLDVDRYRLHVQQALAADGT